MTLGEKIREARKGCGLSQEQLAQMLCVSRSAVAKWETDKGLPDVENLKALAQLLHVSIESLLDDGGNICAPAVREAYDLSAYGRGSRKRKKDQVIFEKFPNARIHTLLGKLKLTRSEKIIDNALGFLTDAPFGIPDLINGFKNLDKEFYLVETDTAQLFVTVTDEFIETRRLTQRLDGEKFEIGSWQFIRCAYEVKAK